VISYYYDEKKQCWLHEDHSNDCYYYDIELLLLDGTPFLMKHQAVEHPETMLGVATSPSGSCRSKCSCSEECNGPLDILIERASDDCAQKVLGLGSGVNRRKFKF